MHPDVDIEDRGNFVSITLDDKTVINIGKKHSLAAGNCELDIKQNKGSVKLIEKDKELEREELETEESFKEVKFDGEYLEASFKVEKNIVSFDIDAKESNFIEFSIPARTDEHFFGMGEQFTGPELTGEKVPVVVQEQGIGRGKPMVSKAVEMLSKGSSGHSTSTYFPLPRFVSSENYALELEEKGITQFEFTNERAIISAYKSSLEGKITVEENLKSLLEDLGDQNGTMNKPPGWTSSGAVLGVQGGREEVFRKLDSLRHAGAPISAVWIQDWEGQRSTLAGKQLWWDWSLDEERYSDWTSFADQLERENIKILGYINPYLVERGEECLFDVARDRDLLLKDDDGEIIFEKLAGFEAAMLDLSREETCDWVKKIIRKNMVEEGFDGWMADFGESLPFNSTPENEDAREFHNRYAEKWIELNSKVADKHNCFFFNRTGFTESNEKSQMVWCGDQLTTWDHYDGMESTLHGMINAGMSGITNIHSDTGGYHSFNKVGVGISRSKELLKRWTELNAFTSMLRTHEGNQPSSNAQVYDEDVREHFAKFAKVFQTLSSYRRKLLTEAENSNMPVVRHMALEFEDEDCWSIGDQFMFGSELLVAPILEKNSEWREVYLPEGEWRHIFSDYEFESEGEIIGFKASLGQPAVFMKSDSDEGLKLLNSLEKQGLM